MNNLIAEGHNDLCVGIDLGTTNSVLATINEKPNGDLVSKVVDISRSEDMYNAVSGEAKFSKVKKPTLPSCVYYIQEKNYEPLVGDFAKRQYPLRPHLVAKSIKSQMGRPVADGLDEEIPDKTPAQISARILKHLLREASKVYRCDIKDAVITVPANFDSAMCKATRDAAELAGIKVKNADGSERAVLLSEPNAVIYDLINQVHNGEISSRILDLREKKRVLVFDLGGGTLDITMHEIKRRDDNNTILKVDEIATNRYTLLGGDDFDEAIAKVMYMRYLKQYANHSDVVTKLRKEEKAIMAQMRVYAEHMKLELNERCGDDYDSDSGWDDPEDELDFPTGGNMGGIGFSYDDTFTKEEIESILSVFMASDLKYDDYKQIEKITNTRNIIYPILDVLKKAVDKLGVSDITVDAVIVNGGMSKFYMVTDRLKEFFGFDPIVALDPDQAVARGAAVYHYYLHKYDEMQDDMRLLGTTAEENSSVNPLLSSHGSIEKEKQTSPRMAIEWGSNILNDCLYLGVKNGAVHEIIPTGADLPYTSGMMTGFKLEPGQNMIAVPIKSRNIDGSYRIIANGNITFKQKYPNGAYVTFRIHMGSNKVITMKAWTSTDIDGTKKIEEGSTEIAIDNHECTKNKNKIVPPSGSRLDAEAEIHNMLQLCKNLEKNGKSKGKDKSNIAKRIAACVEGICSAQNKEDFSTVILKQLENVSSEEVRQRLFTISRKIGTSWNEKEKRKLAQLCMNQISAEINGLSMGSGPKISTNIQAIYTLSMCANETQLEKLSVLHDRTKYLHACLYAHAKTKTGFTWIKEEFEQDAKKVLRGNGSNIQVSVYAIGIALRKDELTQASVSVEMQTKIVNKICDVISSGNLSSEELTCSILALGWICDQRRIVSDISNSSIRTAIEIIKNLGDYYRFLNISKQEKSCQIAMKMINGDALDVEEERFLLTKLEK